MAGFPAAASARYPPTLVAALLPHHCPATTIISSLHLPPAGYLCFTRSCIVRRRGCGAASSPRAPPLRTPGKESLGHFSGSRRREARRRQASPAVAVAVACALGTACLLRVAVFVAPLSLSRLARSRSITKAAASGGDKLDHDHSKDQAEHSAEDGCREVIIEGPDRNSDRNSPLTPIMLGKILPSKQTDSDKIRLLIQLLHHVFTAVIPLSKQLQLLERVCQLAFPENEVLSENWLSPDEKLEAGLALAQIYMAMNKYKDAEQVLKRLSLPERITPSPTDDRLRLLKEAVELLGSERTRMVIGELLGLIAQSEDLRTPPKTED